jgi:hypothetical protein
MGLGIIGHQVDARSAKLTSLVRIASCQCPRSADPDCLP